MQIHWPLVFSTVCQRVGLGMFVFALLSQLIFGVNIPMNIVALTTLALLVVGGIASIFHLKRPQRFFNAFSNISSHLTQEAFITPFLGIALLVCGLNGILFDAAGITPVIDVIAGVLALAFLICTGLAYQMGSRPAWNTSFVLILFLLTAAEAGGIATLSLCLILNLTVSSALLTTVLMVTLICIGVQFGYIRRMRSVGYGVNVNVSEEPYRSTFIAWITFGVVLTLAGTLLVWVIPFATLALFTLLCSALGIGSWTVLFFKGAQKVKMFPMYPVDLNLDM